MAGELYVILEETLDKEASGIALAEIVDFKLSQGTQSDGAGGRVPVSKLDLIRSDGSTVNIQGDRADDLYGELKKLAIVV